MAFSETTLSRIHPSGQRLYLYYDETDADPAASGFFDDMASELNVGDVIIVHMNSGSTNDGVYVLAVDTNDGTTVTTSGGEMAP